MTTKRLKSRTMKFLESIAGSPLTVGLLINSIRLAEEASLATFSAKLKITISHLCDIEKGRKSLSVERAARFAKILGRSQEQFVRLALQDSINQAGLKMVVSVKAA